MLSPHVFHVSGVICIIVEQKLWTSSFVLARKGNNVSACLCSYASSYVHVSRVVPFPMAFRKPKQPKAWAKGQIMVSLVLLETSKRITEGQVLRITQCPSPFLSRLPVY